jgi:cytochrome d ubiquinol oxidase subunit II
VSVVAFCLLAGMLSVYVILDGYDLGASAISPLLAKTREERDAIVASIGPFWSGNEVWLVAAGGTLFALFPRAYAISFSGFYLPFIIVLWLLMVRGIALEVREHLAAPMWTDFWDVALSLSSVLLILLFGVALGNLIRGIPLSADGYFQGTFSSLLNPYSTAVGLLAVAALIQHGLAYVADNAAEKLAGRALQYIGRVWWFVLAAYLAVTALTIAERPEVVSTTWIDVGASAIGFTGLVCVGRFASSRRRTGTLGASAVFLLGLLVAASSTMYPFLIRPYHSAAGGLTISAAAPPSGTLAIALAVAISGLSVVTVYTILLRRAMSSRRTTSRAEG